MLLIAAIAIGATVMAGNFRERALHNSERELENTVLLLARHFDQQLEDFTGRTKRPDRLHAIERRRHDGELQARMSSREIHLMLKSKLEALSYVGGINVFDADGVLINASLGMARPIGERRGPSLFQDLQVRICNRRTSWSNRYSAGSPVPGPR